MTTTPQLAALAAPQGGAQRPSGGRAGAAWPQSITNHEASGVLSLQWSDGGVSDLPHWLLRSRCRCGGCEQQRRSIGELPDAPFATRLTDIRPVADKALNLVFSDGHERGLYPWDYLREIGRAHGCESTPQPALAD
jgi:DUF971 family protein